MPLQLCVWISSCFKTYILEGARPKRSVHTFPLNEGKYHLKCVNCLPELLLLLLLLTARFKTKRGTH